MNAKEKTEVLQALHHMKWVFANAVHLNLPSEMAHVGGTAFQLEQKLLELEAEVKAHNPEAPKQEA